MSSKTTATKEEATPALVPKLRFPEFKGTDGWKPSVLADACDMQAGKFVSASNIAERDQAGLFPCYGGNGLRGYTTTHTHDGTYPLIGRQGALCGNVRLVSGHFHATEHAVVATPKKAIHVGWLHYSLDLLNLNRFATGQAQPGLSVDVLENVALAIPLLEPEQQKIAECLSSVDELMAAQARKLDALKTHKKGLMQQLFPREGETQPRLRFPEFQNAGEWEQTTVGGLVEAGTLYPPKDGNHGNIHPKSSDYVAQGIPFIMASDLNGGLIDIENCHFISEEQADTLQKGFAKEGDILLSHKGTVGEVAVVRKINTPYLMLTPQVTYYRVKNRKQLSNEFLAQLFVAEAFQSNLLEVSGGGTRAYIGITEQAKLRAQLPKQFEEQQRIASCLSSLDALITAEAQKLEALKTHKRGLMQQLFPSPDEIEA